MKILVNDGIDPVGQRLLEEAGIEVDTQSIPQEALIQKLPAYDGIVVRSATKVRKELIDACPNLKVIGRGGVGLDNIDVDYAKSKGVAVVNTPAASSASVAELVFAHLYSGVRFLTDAQRQMPVVGDTQFSALKKKYGSGIELKGKTLGIIGFGRIGQETAKIALGVGMDVIVSDIQEVPSTVSLQLSGGIEVQVPIKQLGLDTLIKEADFISLHVPFLGKALLDREAFKQMKDGVGIVNASRGGIIDEDALLEALDQGKVAFAGLDVFENEPTPKRSLLEHERISLSPHIGAATNEAQNRVGIELAEKIIQELVLVS